jgi:hypothetical protein
MATSKAVVLLQLCNGLAEQQMRFDETVIGARFPA